MTSEAEQLQVHGSARLLGRAAEGATARLSVQAAAEVAAGLALQLEGILADLRPVRGAAAWSAAKSIAIVALLLERRHDVARAEAVVLAANAVHDGRPMSRGALKTRTSEARALLAYGLAPALAGRRTGTDADLLCELVRHAQGLRVHKACRRRADELARTQGGRPAGTALVRAVKTLIEQDQAGDPAARAQLVAMSVQLSAWMGRALQRAQPGGPRR